MTEDDGDANIGQVQDDVAHVQWEDQLRSNQYILAYLIVTVEVVMRADTKDD